MFTNLSDLGGLESISLNFKTNRLGHNGLENFRKMKCSEYLKYM